MYAIDSNTQPLQALRFEDDGATPNSRFPVLLYRLQLAPAHDNAGAFETFFAAHQWTPLWRAGIFDYQCARGAWRCPRSGSDNVGRCSGSGADGQGG
jgi:hypothetical protein